MENFVSFGYSNLIIPNRIPHVINLNQIKLIFLNKQLINESATKKETIN